MDRVKSKKRNLNEDFLDLLHLLPTLAVPSPVLITLLPANVFPNRLAPNVPNNILRNPPLCSLASILIVSLIPSNSIPESSRDLTIFKMSPFHYLKLLRLYYDQIVKFFMYS